MPSFNHVTLIGRLTRDPELRYSQNGLAITKFSIAVDRRFKNQQGERVTDFFDCSAFRQTAEFVANYVTKGRLVCVDGRIEMNQTTGQDGQKRYYTNIICDSVETLDAQRDAEGGGAAAGGAAQAGGGAPRNNAPQGGGDDNGYFPDEEPAPRAPAPPRAAPPNAGGTAGGGAAAGGGYNSGGNAPRAATPPAGGARPPAAPAYPAEDDFDDTDPFADQ